jgi:hypothetical protein
MLGVKGSEDLERETVRIYTPMGGTEEEREK